MTSMTRGVGIGLATGALTAAVGGGIYLVSGTAEASAATPASVRLTSTASPSESPSATVSGSPSSSGSPTSTPSTCSPGAFRLPLSVKLGKSPHVGQTMRITVKVHVDATAKTAAVTLNDGKKRIDKVHLTLTKGAARGVLGYPAHKAGRHVLTVTMQAPYTEKDSCNPTAKPTTYHWAEEQFSVKVLPRKR